MMKKQCRLCCCSRSISINTVAIYSLIQSALYIAASVLGILVHKCQIAMDSFPTAYLMYLTYFRDKKECGDVNWSKLNLDVSSNLQPQINDDFTEQTTRTTLFAYIYLGLNAFWFVSSLMLLIGSCSSSCRNKCCHALCYQPWILATVANIILDIVASYYYYLDLLSTYSLSSFLEWLQIINADEMFEALKGKVSEFGLAYPSLIIGIVTSRFFVLFLLNIWFVIMIVAIWYEVLCEISYKSPALSMVNSAELQHRDNYGYEPELPIEVPGTNRNVKNVNNDYVRSISDYHRSEFTNELDEAVERRFKNFRITTSNMVPPINYDEYEDKRPRDGNQHKGEHVSNLRLSLQQSIDNMAPPKKPVYNVTPDREKEFVTMSPTASEKVNRDVNRDGQPVSRSSSFNAHPPPELRSQLPWSYFKGQEDPSNIPKKILLHTTLNEEEPPQVPEPDYNASFRHEAVSPRKARTNRSLSTGSESGEWSGPDVLL